jgi:hypothetical protein
MPTSEQEVRDKVVLDRRPKGRQQWHNRGLLDAALAGVVARPGEDKERGHDLERSALASRGENWPLLLTRRRGVVSGEALELFSSDLSMRGRGTRSRAEMTEGGNAATQARLGEVARGLWLD